MWVKQLFWGVSLFYELEFQLWNKWKIKSLYLSGRLRAVLWILRTIYPGNLMKLEFRHVHWISVWLCLEICFSVQHTLFVLRICDSVMMPFSLYLRQKPCVWDGSAWFSTSLSAFMLHILTCLPENLFDNYP